METIRTFIALELTPEIQEQLGHIQSKLKKSNADVKWVDPRGIHLTVKFLGDISLKLVDEIKKVISQTVKTHKCFQLGIKQLGAFPKIEYPRVIWVGIKQGFEQIIKFAQDLEEPLIKLGFLPEKRPLMPHLTLGRVRSANKRAQLKELMQSITFPQKAMQIDTVILFKSTLTPQGAIYEALYKAKLS